MKLIQLIKDFRKWRAERYKEEFDKVITDIVYSSLVKAENCGEREISRIAFGEMMLRYGLNHRKEILKKVKI